MLHARLVGASLLAMTLVLGACGGDDDDDSTSSGDNSTETTQADQADQATTTEPQGQAAAVTVAVADTDLGQVLVDGEGNTLYGFTVDTAGTPTCAGSCASNWPALTVEGEPTLGEGLDPAVFTTVQALDGGMQLKAGDYPLYRFSGDAAAGETNGQGVGGVWYAVRPDGTLVQE